jgi:ABC-2 type transport system permease protein
MAAILRKDVYLLFREFIFVFMTVLSLVFFVGMYWLLPKNVDETISLGITGAGIENALSALAGEADEGIDVSWYGDTAGLENAVSEKEIEIGLSFPDDFIMRIRSGDQVSVRVLSRANMPSEITGAMSSLVRELSYGIAGYPLPVSQPAEETVILGIDRAGEQLSIRDRLKPLYAFLLLIVEAIALGALIASEIQHRTVTAVLATPARLGDMLAAKGIIGTLLAFSESALVLLLIRGFGPSPGIVLVAIFLGAIMVTGVAMISGAAGKDFVSTMLLGMVFLIPLCIPAFTVLLPGAAAPWVRALPSYGLVQAIVGTSFYGYGWADAGRYLATLAAWCVVFAAVGILILQRRVKTL